MIYSLLESVSSFENYWWGPPVPPSSLILQKCVNNETMTQLDNTREMSLTCLLILSIKLTFIFFVIGFLPRVKIRKTYREGRGVAILINLAEIKIAGVINEAEYAHSTYLHPVIELIS